MPGGPCPNLNCIAREMNGFELRHCGDIYDWCAHCTVTQRGKEVCSTGENRATRLSERVDCLFKCSGPQIQQGYLRAVAGIRWPNTPGKLLVYRVRLFVKQPENPVT
jgi:hypothetical protein